MAAAVASADDWDRGLGVPADLLGGAAEEPAPYAGVAAMADHDQVGVLVGGGLHDLLGGVARADEALQGDAVGGG